MSDQEKTEEPTQKKIDDSHKKGQFARAEEVGATGILLAAFGVLVFSFPTMAESVRQFSRRIWNHLHEFELGVQGVTGLMQNIIRFTVELLSPLFFSVIVMALIAGGIQSGFKFTPEALKFKPENISPVSGFKRIFSLKSLVQTGVDLLKFIAVGIITLYATYRIASDPIFYSTVPLLYLGEFIYKTAVLLMLYFVIAIGIIALIHYVYQKWQTQKDMRMSKQEIKDERKQSEGDPMVKSAMRAMAKRLADQKMFADVKTADVVVTNPTHFAVALRYQRGVDVAPVVVAKGQNKVAQHIKKLAREHGVPTVENKPVARSLYKFCNVGDVIPTELYDVVATILAKVFQASQRVSRK